MPRYEDVEWTGLEYDRAQFRKITDVRREAAQGEVEGVTGWFAKFGARLPRALADQLAGFAQRVTAMAETWRPE
jgi:phosphoenolpyruvate carboxykinase (GTP)